MLLACSGAADVGEIADHAARSLAKQGAGKMFCLIGIAAGISDMVEKGKGAAKLLVIDGCPKACGKVGVEKAGITKYQYVRLDTLGMEKGQTPATDANVQKVVAHAVAALA